MTIGRWALEPVIQADGTIDLCSVVVRTPRGTGPGAYATSLLSREFLEMDYRRAMAMGLRMARRNASAWRRAQLCRNSH